MAACYFGPSAWAVILRFCAGQVVCRKAKRVWPSGHRTSRGKTRFFPDLFRAPGGVPCRGQVPQNNHGGCICLSASGLPSAGAQYGSGGSPPSAQKRLPEGSLFPGLGSIAGCGGTACLRRLAACLARERRGGPAAVPFFALRHPTDLSSLA